MEAKETFWLSVVQRKNRTDPSPKSTTPVSQSRTHPRASSYCHTGRNTTGQGHKTIRSERNARNNGNAFKAPIIKMKVTRIASNSSNTPPIPPHVSLSQSSKQKWCKIRLSVLPVVANPQETAHIVKRDGLSRLQR